MLAPKNIKRLAKGKSAGRIPSPVRNMNNEVTRNEWLTRYGWNITDNYPPVLTEQYISIRKVEIHDVYDLKQWVWKGTDGIRETTWPYVYNRSRLQGRSDYFIEPDWNCYSGSGKSVTFTMPDEQWNHMEISGSTYGTFSLVEDDSSNLLFRRPEGYDRTVHHFESPYQGGKVRFDNDLRENPIREFTVFHVTGKKEPTGTSTLSYIITGKAESGYSCLDTLINYINGRFLPDERQIMVALPDGAPRKPGKSTVKNPLPLVHILIPFDFRPYDKLKTAGKNQTWVGLSDGLDGIAIDLPALDVKPTHGGYIPLNIQVKDPLWENRNMLDFSFSVKPGEAKTLWLDTRDRILPEGYPLYITIAGAGEDFGHQSLEGTKLRLVFKARKDAVQEHEKDRFAQIVDNYGNIIECGPRTRKLKMFDRYQRDLTDLLQINPDHFQGQMFRCHRNTGFQPPPFKQSEAPEGVPLWAYRQIENLKLVKQFINWWLDKRQVKNGEFGGGLSDDGDMTNQWPGPALMGVEPKKITNSILRMMEAFYENNMFTNGLPTIQTDELHVYEEGINVIPQTQLLDYGDPKVIERLMKTAKAYELITGINDLGHRQIISTFFSGSKIYSESVWAGAQTHYSHLILHAGLVLVEFNGLPAAKKLLIEVTDGLLAYYKKDENGNYYFPRQVFYPSGKTYGRSDMGYTISLFWAVWRWTGDEKYLKPILDNVARGNYDIFNRINGNFIDLLDKRETWGSDIAKRFTPGNGSSLMQHSAWQVTGDKKFLEELYADQIRRASQGMFINTGAHFWTDRVGVNSMELQRARLGGIALRRSSLYPGHVVSWRFFPPFKGESVAILVPEADREKVTIIVYNPERFPVPCFMTVWDIDPGTWNLTVGIDEDGDDKIDIPTHRQTIELERTGNIKFTFPPGKTTIIELNLKTKGKPYWERPDLGIGKDDIKVDGNKVTVTIHSLGSVDAPKSNIALINSNGKTLATAHVPPLRAPLDYLPKTAEVILKAPSDTVLKGCMVQIDPDGEILEITERNNVIIMP